MDTCKAQNRRYRHALKAMVRHPDDDVLLNLHDLELLTQGRTGLGLTSIGRYRKMGRGNQEVWREV